jgi:AcrR family transcriptional regulator
MPSHRDSATHTPSARERILQTAHDLFYREGIRATGIDLIIARSGVAKVTFYRHFPSKNDLIREFLAYRHKRWMDWFSDALQRHGGDIEALVPALAEWFAGSEYRGCAFINSVGELGGDLPEVMEIARRHKQDMADAIADLLPSSRRRKRIAGDIALVVDGTIVRAQMEGSADSALAALKRVLKRLPVS